MITHTRFRYLNELLSNEAYHTVDEYMADQYGLVDLYLELYRIWIEKQQNMNDTMIYEQIQNELALATEYVQIRIEETFLYEHFPMEQVKTLFQFTEFEHFCFLLSSATVRGEKYKKWYEVFNKSEGLTLGLAKELYQFIHQGYTSFYQEFNNLDMRWNYIYGEEFQQQTNITDKRLSIRPELLSYLYGDKSLHKELQGCASLYNRSARNLNKALEEILFIKEEKEKLSSMLEKNTTYKFLLYLQGRRGSGKKYMLCNVADDINQSIVFVDCNTLKYLPESQQNNKLNGILLTAMLHKAWVCYVIEDERLIDTPVEKQLEEERIEKWIARAQQLKLSCIVTSTKELPITNKLHQFHYTYFRMELPLLSSEQRIATWEHLLREKWYFDTVNVTNLGNKYVLSAGEIMEILDTVDLMSKKVDGAIVDNEVIISAVQMHNRNALDEYASSVKTTFVWEDLIVEAEVEEQLRKVCNRVLYRNVIGEQWGFYEKTSYGRGICAVFAGPPGTGKTMAAQVVAKELGYELYRIDLSKMVSKYIGETQKNISQLFQKAKTMNVILFFDEADAFFSKRSEISDSNDRHANSEVAHLLQEIEEYEGICILATNLKGNMDDAFKRRIKYIIDFRLPNEKTRLLLWQSMIPKKAPVSEELDIEYFAKEFELSGSEIKEVIMSAAFIAAADGDCIENIHIIEALKTSYLKYGKVLRTEDFHCLI